MLRPSAADPAVSAFEQLHGPHNYDSYPFSILGSAVEVHVTPKNRQTWAEHNNNSGRVDPHRTRVVRQTTRQGAGQPNGEASCGDPDEHIQSKSLEI